MGAIDATVIFVPAAKMKGAGLEAIAAGVPLLVLVADRVPLYDVMAILEAAEMAGVHFVGPNTVGILSPGKGVLGMMGGSSEAARTWFRPGPVGIVSRSGGLGASAGYYICQEGWGVSTIVHVGGDAVVGMTLRDVIRRFDADVQTELIVMIGEIGTSQEEEVAEFIEQGGLSKPLVAFIGGRSAEDGTRYSHAGAIVEGGRGSYQSKIDRLKAAGAHVVEVFSHIPNIVGQLVSATPSRSR